MAAELQNKLPGTSHGWCRWHMLRFAKQRLGTVYTKNCGFKKEFNTLVTNEVCQVRFERQWRRLVRKYNLMGNKYMDPLYKYRAKWAKPYFMGVFCAGMTSTQRSESANHMVK